MKSRNFTKQKTKRTPDFLVVHNGKNYTYSNCTYSENGREAKRALALLEKFDDEIYVYEKNVDEEPAKRNLLRFFNIFKTIHPEEAICGTSDYYDAFEILPYIVWDAKNGRYTGVCGHIYKIGYCYGIEVLCGSAMYSALMRLYYNFLEDKLSCPKETSKSEEKSK